MTLREMKTAEAFEAMVKMLPHVTAILDDADISAEKAMVKAKKHTASETFNVVMPLVLCRHGDDMIAITAAASGMSEDEVRELPLAEMQAAFDAAWKDVLDFFPSCIRMVMTA